MTLLASIRENAARRFDELGFPARRDEEWRFTNVSSIAKTQFAPAPSGLNAREAEQFEQRLYPREGGPRLVFINGRHSPEFSSGQKLPWGIRATPLREANGAVEAHLTRYADYRDHAFVALNTANFEDGACIEIPPGTVVDEPIHLVFLATGGDVPVLSHPRSLIVIGAGSHATVVESYLGHGAKYFTNAVTEIVAGDYSVVDHYKVQEEDERSSHIATLQVQIGRDANFSTHSISLGGGGLVRNDINAVLAEGSDATVNGLYLASGSQHIDNHTAIDHAKPYGMSHELYKGILGGTSTAVFNGKIIVHRDAQKTDAKQTNRNLVLSENATIHTKPELQIHANDVRCTHGATIGQLDPEAIFYLQSRGIAKEQARDLLMHAFARDIIDRVKVGPVRARLEQILLEKLHALRN